MWIVLSPLRVVDQSGKDDDAENKEEDEEGEFMGARLERLYEDLQSTGMWIWSSGEGIVSAGEWIFSPAECGSGVHGSGVQGKELSVQGWIFSPGE